MSEIKAVIFDADGMVVLGEGFRVRRERDLGIPDAATDAFFRGPFQRCLVGAADLKQELAKVLPAWGWGKGVAAFLDEWFDARDAAFDERFKESISRLREKGIRAYLATNNEKYRCASLLDERGLRAWFDGVFPSFVVGAKKPEPALFAHIERALSLQPAQIMYWDNDDGHVEAAKRSGFAAELYSGYDDYAENMRRVLPHIEVTTVTRA